jgi:hypothetical protein
MGKLSPGKTPYDLMRATFPAGTVSGAPKIRAMQIIADLEGTTRGPYGGCVGYFSFNGNLDTCITIRTALLKDGKAYVQAGGGWVNDSEPEAEFQETVNKSKAMLKAVALAETFAGKQPYESGCPLVSFSLCWRIGRDARTDLPKDLPGSVVLLGKKKPLRTTSGRTEHRWQGDHEAFETLVRRYQRMIYALAYWPVPRLKSQNGCRQSSSNSRGDRNRP